VRLLCAHRERMNAFAGLSSKHHAVIMWVNDIANCCSSCRLIRSGYLYGQSGPRLLSSLSPSRHFTATTLRVGTASVDGVQNSVEFTEKNIRTDLYAMQEIVEINSQSTPTTVIDGEVIIGFAKEKISEKLGL
jgi:glutaredoxin